MQEKKKGVLDWQPGPAAGQVAPFDESYTPRASGRLLSSTDALNPARNFTYTYNAAGDMTLADSPAQTTAFAYDEDHRVLTVARTQAAATTGIENRYDALGRRISRKLTPPASAAVETRYVLDLTGSMERILCDTTTAGAITARYIHGPDGLGYREDAATGAITCFHGDAMGNIIRLTNTAGATTAEYAYSPYGRVPASTGNAANPYRFVGSQGVMEELPNLYFMRARYYSAEAGVFLSTDPVKNTGPMWRPEAYGYANGNPLHYSDPEGLTYNPSINYAGTGSRGIDNWFFTKAPRLVGVDVNPGAYRHDERTPAEGPLDAFDAGLDLYEDIRRSKPGGLLSDSSIIAGLYVPIATLTVVGKGYIFGWKPPVSSGQTNGVSGGQKLTATVVPGSYANSTAAAILKGQTVNQKQATTTLTVIGGGTGGTSSTNSQTGSKTSGNTGTGGGAVHTVIVGDTLGNIASRNGTTATALGAANGIKNLNFIRPGQKLTIPKAKRK